MLARQGSAGQGHLLLVTGMCVVELTVAVTLGRVAVCHETWEEAFFGRTDTQICLALEADLISFVSLVLLPQSSVHHLSGMRWSQASVFHSCNVHRLLVFCCAIAAAWRGWRFLKTTRENFQLISEQRDLVAYVSGVAVSKAAGVGYPSYL